MSHKAKAKAKGISTSSFFDLKAELSKQEADFAKSKAAGKSTAIVGGVQRPDKKPTVWARQNKGVAARASRDMELEAISKPTLDSARSILERKAKIYDKLRKGKSGGLNEAQYDALLVDFDAGGPSRDFESDSEDVDESRNVPVAPDGDDPIVEYEDEFGRIRTAPRSEVPRHILLKLEGGEDDDDPIIDYEDEFGRQRSGRRSEVPRHLWPPEVDPDADLVIHNPVGYFPVYEPSAERIAQIEKAAAESNKPLAAHYDASNENRAKGAGFYQFSADEETRKKQMDELQKARLDTERARQETGAVDLRPGDAEVMQDGEAYKSTTVSRAMEKRKRELEERRKLIESKRRKVVAKPAEETKGTPQPSATTGPEVQTKSPVMDPFAVLEAHTTQKQAGPSRDRLKEEPTNAADAFLGQLEREFMSKTRR